MTTLVLLPGLLCDEALWADQVNALSVAHCHVPSYGRRDSLAAMAEHVLREVHAPRFSLAGHSMGGRVALEILRRAPDRIERLALLDSGVDAIASGAAGDTERARRLALLELAQRQGMRAMGREWARAMVHPARLGSAVFDSILEMVERKTPDVFAAQIAALLARPDARDVLTTARCDVLLVCGRQDTWSPLVRHQEMQALRPDSRLVVIDDSGHMSPMEQPQAVTRCLAQWLRPG